MTNKADLEYLNDMLKDIQSMTNKDDLEYLNGLPKESSRGLYLY